MLEPGFRHILLTRFVRALNGPETRSRAASVLRTRTSSAR